MLLPLNSPLRNKWVVLAILVAILATLAVIGYTIERHRLTTLTNERDALLVERAGLQRALEAKPKEVIKLVEKEVPKEVIKLIKEKVLVPMASGTITSQPQPVPIPCPHLQPGEDQPKVDVALTGWYLLNSTRDGGVVWDGAWTVGLSQPGGWTASRTFNPTNATIEMRVSSELTDTLRAHASERRFAIRPRSPGQWRTGWIAGGGISYDPFNGHMAPALFVGWGGQF